MNEPKQKSKGLIVTVVILIILLLGLGGYTAYDMLVIQKDNEEELVELNNDLKDANKKITELEQDKEKYSSVEEKNYIASNFYGENKDFNIYAIGYTFIVYGCEDSLYMAIFNDSDEDVNLLNILVSEDPTKSSDDYKVTDLKVKESDISKVVASDNFYARDASSFAYIIYKDGTVKRYYVSPSTAGKNDTVLKNYKVKNLKVKCGKTNEESCETLSYDLTLQDGTTKTVTEK